LAFATDATGSNRPTAGTDSPEPTAVKRPFGSYGTLIAPGD